MRFLGQVVKAHCRVLVIQNEMRERESKRESAQECRVLCRNPEGRDQKYYLL